MFVHDVQLAAELCIETPFDKKLPPDVAALRTIAGDDLLTAYFNEPNWRLAHDSLRPVCTRPAMRSEHQTMLKVAAELVDFYNYANGSVDALSS